MDECSAFSDWSNSATIYGCMRGALWFNLPAWVSAIALSSIGYFTYKLTKNNAQMTQAATLNEMYNNWHKLCIDDAKSSSSSERISVIKTMRPHIISQEDDSIVYTYLNILLTQFRLKGHGLVEEHQYEIVIKNGASRLKFLRPEVVEEFLAHGYEAEFSNEVRRALLAARKDNAGSGHIKHH